MDGFEWDPDKALSNLQKHGIGFEDAALALMNLAVTASSSRIDEQRFRSICRSGSRLIVVVWTPRDGVIRLISARAARKNEQTQFRQAIGK